MEPAPPDDPTPEREALRGLYEEHGPALLRFLSRLLGERAAAEDALQETFLRVDPSRLDPARPPLPYLLTVARNVGLGALRRRALRRAAGEEALAGAATAEASPPQVSLASEARAEVQSALASLPGGLRAALLLRHDQGLTVRAVGEALGVSERTARVRLREATVLLARARRARGYLEGGVQ